MKTHRPLQADSHSQQGPGARPPRAHSGPYPGAAGKGLNRLAFRRLDRLLARAGAAVRIRLWDDSEFEIGQGVPACTWVFHDRALASSLWWGSPTWKLALAYTQGLMDVEGDLFATLRLRHVIDGRTMSRISPDTWHVAPGTGWAERALEGLSHLWRPVAWPGGAHARHSRQADVEAISMHYDIPLAFYALWLDTQLVYSCAYFEHPDDDLDQAQRNKMDLVCRKLRLHPGERLLDVGCGWGGLLFWAARHYGVKAHGITLSHAQHAHVSQRIVRESMQEWITVSLLDYRDLPTDASFDKVCSIGMAEHVGLDQLGPYFEAVRGSLRPGGLFLLHCITQDKSQHWSPTGGDFMDRFVFPGGELDSVAHLLSIIERRGFEVHDLESLRQHYGMSLRQWVARLQARAREAREEVGDRTLRTWILYMAACAIDFEEGGLGVYQILLSKRGADPSLPLTREDLCNRGASRAGGGLQPQPGSVSPGELGAASRPVATLVRNDDQVRQLSPHSMPLSPPLRALPAAARQHVDVKAVAAKDPLTGLRWGEAMMACLRRHMAQAEAGGQTMQLVDLDVHRFESVNDRHGYLGGDHLLQTVAARLQRAVQDHGDVFRIGGNEFVVLMSFEDGRGGLQLARELREAVLRPVIEVAGAPMLDVDLGVGHASHPGPAIGAEQLLRAARDARLDRRRAALTGQQSQASALVLLAFAAS